MKLPISIFIVLTLMAVSTRSINTDGISGYCEKSRIHKLWYVRTPIECCNDNGKCDKYIGPGETKYGLTNPDKKWPRRLCSCDKKLYRCVTERLGRNAIEYARRWGFSAETCFYEWRMQYNETILIRGYEFIPLLKKISMFQPRGQ